MDSRVTALTPWQKIVYDLCWKCGASHNPVKQSEAGKQLEQMKAERPGEYEQAFKVWEEIMYEVLY